VAEPSTGEKKARAQTDGDEADGCAGDPLHVRAEEDHSAGPRQFVERTMRLSLGEKSQVADLPIDVAEHADPQSAR